MVRHAERLGAAALGRFRDDFAGEIVLPGDPGYDAARVVWNGIVDRRPAIVARCAGRPDVVAALRFAREESLLVAVRSGGHSIAGLSTCDGGIVIDLSRMRGATVDPARRVARVNGGALLAELDVAAQAHGLVCPVGVVGHTGVAGLTLGGGMGRLMRRFGLTIDSLVSVDLVTADGTTATVSAESDPELFWGLRGAGANFGIATAFEFRLRPFDGTLTHGWMLFPAERGHEVAARFADLLATAGDECMPTFGATVGGPDDPPEVAGRPVVVVGMAHSGDPEAAERELRPVRDLGPLVDMIAPKRYLDVQTMNDEEMAWGKRFYMKSAFLPDLSPGVVDACLAWATSAPPDCSISLWAWGGAIARVGEDETAFTGRTARLWAAAEAFWGSPHLDENRISWGRSAMRALEPFSMAGRYVNDVAESGEDVVRVIYGETKLARLAALKRRMDPDNVLRMNQNITP